MNEEEEGSEVLDNSKQEGSPTVSLLHYTSAQASHPFPLPSPSPVPPPQVSRSLAACQGALLLVDASQGVQAQTVANHNAAVEAGLRIIPVLTKIDLPTADPEPCLAAMETALHIDPDSTLWTSAKSGAGIDEVLPAIVERLPAPGSNELRAAPLRCLLFDSWFDPYRGVVCSVLVVEGVLRPGETIIASHSGDKFVVQEVGLMSPAKVPIGTVTGPLAIGTAGSAAAAAGSSNTRGALAAGQMGYMIAGMKSTKQAVVGDTFVQASRPVPPLPGFRPAKPMVFASLYPVDSSDFTALVTAVDRLTLNDASVSVERESSNSLGLGLRCGFLGLLHMDVFHQRLQGEFQMPVILTAPMVAYKLKLLNGTVMTVERPGDFPPAHDVEENMEPTVHVSIMTPSVYVSPLMGLLTDRRGVQEDVVYLTGSAAAGTAIGPGLGAAAGEGTAASSSSPPSSTAAGAGAAAEELAAEEESSEEEDADEDEEEEQDEEEDDLDLEGLSDSSSSSSSSADWEKYKAIAAASAASPEEGLGDRVVLKYRLPWAEVVGNLYDAVKSISAGYASLDWTPGDYQKADIVKVDVLVNSKPVDALSFVAHKSKAVSEGRKVCQKLKGVISRQQFEIVIQAAIGNKIFAKERIAPFRKDVLIKSGKTVGGGDKTRKQKLLAKQKEGKKRMKTVGNVQLSQEAFHSIMSK